MNWLLILAVVIVAASAYLGWRRGFVKSVFSLTSTVLVILLTIIISPIVSNIMKQNDSIADTIQEKLDLVINLDTQVAGEEEELDPFSFIEDLELPNSMKETMKNVLSDNMDDASEETQAHREEQIEALEDYICSVLTNMIINAISVVVTFIVAALAVYITCNVLNVISKLPVLHQINALAGVAFGAAEGILLLWIFFVVITMFGTTEFGQRALALIGESEILSFLYDNNVLSRFITGKV